MSTKQDRKFKRWDLALGGTNILPPYGVEPEPWPEWLSKTPVNTDLLQVAPIELRDSLFLGRDPKNTWGLVDNLLFMIEKQAEKILAEDDRRYLDGLTEEQFHDVYHRLTSNTPKQANAIAALRSIEVIRSLTHVFDNRGYPMCDPHAAYKYESLTVAKIIMETATLITAAIRGELWEDIWPHTERSVLTSYQRRDALRIAAEKRKQKSNKMAELCRSIAEKSMSKTARGRALFVQKTLKGQRKRLSISTIQNLIR